MKARTLVAEIVTQFSECTYKEHMKPLDWLQWRMTNVVSELEDEVFNLNRKLSDVGQCEECERRREVEADADEGMRTAAEIAGMQ